MCEYTEFELQFKLKNLIISWGDIYHVDLISFHQ